MPVVINATVEINQSGNTEVVFTSRYSDTESQNAMDQILAALASANPRRGGYVEGNKVLIEVRGNQPGAKTA